MYALDIVWDPSSEGINIFGKFTIHYYSLMWIAAFTIGHYVMKKIYQKESLSEESLDSLFMYTILGTIIGARLGHVVFYQAELFQQDFFSVFLPFRFNPTFEFTGFRGLASHGAAIGMIFSMYLYNKKVFKIINICLIKNSFIDLNNLDSLVGKFVSISISPINKFFSLKNLNTLLFFMKTEKKLVVL